MGTALLARWLLDPLLPNASSYLFFLLPTAIVACACNFGATLATLALGFILANPRYTLHLSTTDDCLNLLVYAIVGSTLAWLAKRRNDVPSSTIDQPPAIAPPHEQPPQVPARETSLPDAAQQLEAFAYTISHDLRAPLRAIKGFTNALREDYAHVYDEQGKLYAQRVVEGTERMEEMIAALLSYSRVGRGEIPLVKIELEDCLTNLSKQWSAQVQARNGSLELVRPLPAVFANPSLLDQVLTQLVTNALTFVSPDTKPCVKVSTETSGGFTKIKVVDNGIGIHEKHMPKLFQIFQRFNSADKYPGIGIGLAIVRKAAERMGGRVGVESEPNKGSCFWIELRAAP
jgi:signal transduction histidine kinase